MFYASLSNVDTILGLMKWHIIISSLGCLSLLSFLSSAKQELEDPREREYGIDQESHRSVWSHKEDCVESYTRQQFWEPSFVERKLYIHP